MTVQSQSKQREAWPSAPAIKDRRVNESQSMTQSEIETAPEQELVPAPSTIWIWVCPRCASWYGSSSAPDLATAPNRRSSLLNRADEDPSEYGKITSYRDECKHCKARDNVAVKRVLVQYVRAEAVADVIAATAATLNADGVSEQVPYERPTATD